MNAVSCASPGNCTIGGTYFDHAEDWQAFVVTEKNGTWGKPLEISAAGLRIQGPIDSAEIDFVACERPGACDAIGDYQAMPRRSCSASPSGTAAGARSPSLRVSRRSACGLGAGEWEFP
jgi:hypothetical protein